MSGNEKIGEMIIEIRADVEKVKKSVKGLESSIKKSGERAGASFSKSLISSIGKVGIRLYLLKKAFDFAVTVKNVARDANEIGSKFHYVFKNVQDEAIATATKISNAFGMSMVTSKQFLSYSGDILVGFGYSEKQALQMSEKITKLAADLASFTNIEGGTMRAARALTGALTGETEALKSLGIVIRQDDPAFRKRLKQLQEEKGMTLAQARAQIILDEAYKQSGKAIGDYARTKDQLANVERRLHEQMKDLYVMLGNYLIPLFQKGTLAALKFIRSFVENDMDEAIRRLSELGIKTEELQKYINIKVKIENIDKIKDIKETLRTLRGQNNWWTDAQVKISNPNLTWDINSLKEKLHNAPLTIGDDQSASLLQLRAEKDLNAVLDDKTPIKEKMKIYENLNNVISEDYKNLLKAKSLGQDDLVSRIKARIDIYESLSEVLKQVIDMYSELESREKQNKIIDGVVKPEKSDKKSKKTKDGDPEEKKAADSLKSLMEKEKKLKDELLQASPEDFPLVSSLNRQLQEVQTQIELTMKFYDALKQGIQKGFGSEVKPKGIDNSTLNPTIPKVAPTVKVGGSASESDNGLVQVYDTEGLTEGATEFSNTIQSTIGTMDNLVGIAQNGLFAAGKGFFDYIKDAATLITSAVNIINGISTIAKLLLVAHTGGVFKGGQKVMGLSSGGSFIVPDGFPNDSYPIMVESGEKVSVTPASGISAEFKLLSEISSNIKALNKNIGVGGAVFIGSSLSERDVVVKQKRLGGIIDREGVE